MTPEEFARQCAEMREFWWPLVTGAFSWMMITVAFLLMDLVAFLYLPRLRVLWWNRVVRLFLCGNLLAVIIFTLWISRGRDPVRFIYQSDFADHDYRAFLERMKYEPKQEESK